MGDPVFVTKLCRFGDVLNAVIDATDVVHELMAKCLGSRPDSAASKRPNFFDRDLSGPTDQLEESSIHGIDGLLHGLRLFVGKPSIE